MKEIKQTDRAFGLMFAAVFVVFYAIGWFFFDSTPHWLLGIAGAFLVVALIAPGLLLPLNRLWGHFALRLGRLNNFVLLGLFFYLFVFPAGMIFKLIKRDPMHREPDPSASSYWQSVGRHADPETYRDMF